MYNLDHGHTYAAKECFVRSSAGVYLISYFKTVILKLFSVIKIYAVLLSRSDLTLIISPYSSYDIQANKMRLPKHNAKDSQINVTTRHIHSHSYFLCF